MRIHVRSSLDETVQGVPRHDEPVRLGIPLANGKYRDHHHLCLADSAGRRIPVQARPLDHWRDGSIRWVLLDFLANHDGARPVVYDLVVIDDGRDVANGRVVSVREERDRTAIDTGVAQFALGRGRRFPFEQVLVGGIPAIDAARTTLEIENGNRQLCRVTVSGVHVEDAGPIRAVVRVEARVSEARQDTFADLIARLHFVAGSATVRFEVTLRNPRRAAHPGGFWELGDEGSVGFRDASFVVALPGDSESTEIHCSPEIGARFERCVDDVEVYQDSSGGTHWNSTNHVNRDGIVPLSFRGYRLRIGAVERVADRATPVLAIDQGQRHLAMTMPQFWQNFPKSLEATRTTLRLRLFPRQHAGVHELQGGEQKTHVFHVSFDRDTVTDVPLDWARASLIAMASPADYCSSSVLPYLVEVSEDPNRDYLHLLNRAIEGDDTLECKREVIDEFGWRNFGDIYADHESVFHHGPSPLVSHYNNQYDAIAGTALQFMRSGDIRWWRLFSDLASHVVDVDLYHTDHDKAAYNHGLFWHSAHYVDAGLATHRSFPRAKGVVGGGPSPEHNYSMGLLLHYWLTGSPLSRDAVVALADWVLAMDDGTRTPFRFLARGDTGVASATVSEDYHGPGRGAGNSISVLLDGHRVTGDQKFLSKAETLIRRCIHPADDIDRRDLLDAEQWWSYTVFLCVLGKYLDYKAEREEFDPMYDYARRSLLAYARWMATHERTYLSHPERLEYPTETWVAQEMWKSEVFEFAAIHSDGDERATFLERAEFFYRYCVTTLDAMKTRTYTRPVVLLLSHGFMHGYILRHPQRLSSRCAPPAEYDCGQPVKFVAQKARAKRRLITVAGGAVVLLAAILIGLMIP